jgi:hypothetical protein
METENPDRSEDPSGFLFLQWLNTTEVSRVYTSGGILSRG